MTKPITPAEVVGKKHFPAAVIDAFNELIAECWDGHSANFTQDAVVTRIVAKDPSLERHTIFNRHYLDIEPIFEAAGWKVEYDKPGYCETYSANFTFKKKRKTK